MKKKNIVIISLLVVILLLLITIVILFIKLGKKDVCNCDCSTKTTKITQPITAPKPDDVSGNPITKAHSDTYTY